MVNGFSHIARCVDLTEADIAEGATSRQSAKALLVRLAERSSPDTGAAKVLLVFARLATRACDWIDGELVVELKASSETMTTVDSATDLGGGLRERLMPMLTLKAPLHEFARAIDRVPRLIAPLRVRTKDGSRIVLSATEAIRQQSGVPPPIEIAEESRFVRPERAAPAPAEASLEEASLPIFPAQLPPHDVDAGWDDD